MVVNIYQLLNKVLLSRVFSRYNSDSSRNPMNYPKSLRKSNPYLKFIHQFAIIGFFVGLSFGLIGLDFSRSIRISTGLFILLGTATFVIRKFIYHVAEESLQLSPFPVPIYY